MYDVAIVGAGLSGLALAELLEQEGRSVIVLEARERPGGRILTEVHKASGLAFDLGPTWFWPHRQPILSALVDRLGIQTFSQWDSGLNLRLADVGKGPEHMPDLPSHDGAHRLEGGMQSLVAALLARLRRSEIRLAHAVQGVFDEGDHVRIAWCADAATGEVTARTCVLALPPRLVAFMTFLPRLNTATLSAMQHTPTWMASTAKALVPCTLPHWRAEGLSGSAVVTHGQAVLAETWDACDAAGERAALGGFVSLSPDQRREFAAGLPMLIASQFEQLFGPDLALGTLHYTDWAGAAFTCSAADLAEGQGDHPVVADALLRAAHWGERLYFAGAETSARDPGYLEGALDAAYRVAASIGEGRDRSELLQRPVNAASLHSFGAWMKDQGAIAFSIYRATLSRSLMRQDREQLTQRALLAAAEGVFGDALEVIRGLEFDGANAAVQGRSCLLPALQAQFKPVLDGLLAEVLAFNAASCALSNFPEEHRPAREYLNAMLRDVAAAWAEFSRDANAILLGGASGAALQGAA